MLTFKERLKVNSLYPLGKYRENAINPIHEVEVLYLLSDISGKSFKFVLNL